MTSNRSCVGYVQRVDAILRSRYPNLITKIFELSENNFVITFDAALQEANAISSEFDQSIRFATLMVKVSNSLPTIFMREIPVLTDEEATGSMIGLPLRKADILNLVSSRFPKVEVYLVEDDPSIGVARLILEAQTDENTKCKIKEFLDSFRLPLTFNITTAANRLREDIGSFDDPMFIWAAKLRPNAPQYVYHDEEFWFQKVHEISAGQIPIERFPGIREDVFRCYFDFTSAEQHINLRQALLLYDEVWCSLPLAEYHERFLENQGLSENELLEMVSAERLKLVTVLPEERLNVRFLDAVFERRPESIMGRRTTAALLLADVASTADMSRLRDPSLYPAIGCLAKELAPMIGIAPGNLLRSLLWPFAAQRGALQGLLDRGSKGVATFTLANAIAEMIKSVAQVDFKLETLVLGESVHIAHALNATLFGPLDEPTAYQFVKSAIGHDLNFHRSFNRFIAAAWIGNERRRAEGVSFMPTIPLFDFDTSIPIRELIFDSALGSTRWKGRSLFGRLAELTPEERQSEVDFLVAALRKIARRRDGNLIDVDTVDTGVAVASILGDFLYPPLAGLKSFGQKIIEHCRRNPVIDRMVMQLEEDTNKVLGRNSDLDFLSRISRVATFKRERV